MCDVVGSAGLAHIFARTLPTSTPLPHLHRDWARRCRICAGTGAHLVHSVHSEQGHSSSECNAACGVPWTALLGNRSCLMLPAPPLHLHQHRHRTHSSGTCRSSTSILPTPFPTSYASVRSLQRNRRSGLHPCHCRRPCCVIDVFLKTATSHRFRARAVATFSRGPINVGMRVQAKMTARRRKSRRVANAVWSVGTHVMLSLGTTGACCHVRAGHPRRHRCVYLGTPALASIGS